jgi:hypothetical protein
VDAAILVRMPCPREGLDAATLVEAVKRNGFTRNNANVAVSRIKDFVDFDDAGEMRLLSTGLRRAEEIIKTASS